MVTKTITITEEAYECLLKEKMSGESFTDIIKRLTSRGSLSDCFGLWKGNEKELKDIENIIASAWKESKVEGVDL